MALLQWPVRNRCVDSVQLLHLPTLQAGWLSVSKRHGPGPAVLFSLRGEKGDEASLWLLYTRLSGCRGHEPGGLGKC